MSADPLVLRRNNVSKEIARLADAHISHDLTESDRNALLSAGRKFGISAAVGSLLGLGVGTLFAFRVRRTRRKMYTVFRLIEKPTHITFADGRAEAIPEITSAIKPSVLGDVASYLLFGLVGLSLGGEVGAFTGAQIAHRTFSKDPDSRARIGTAQRRLRAEALRKQADVLDEKKTVSESVEN